MTHDHSSSRRSVILAGLGASLLPCAGHTLASKPQKLFLDLQRDGQRVRLDVLSPQGYKAAAWMLRDIKAGNKTGWPSINLLVWAAQLQQAANEHHQYTVFAVTSGLRTPQTNRSTEGAAQNSLHLPDTNNQFHAMDFKPIGATLDQLQALTQGRKAGGVGRYDSHLHLDVRTSSARW